MDTNAAAEHLQVIRTFMERSALYRRALAPIMTFAGSIGVLAGATGCLLEISAPRSFILFWMLVALGTVAGSFLLVRRQALKDSEPLWSPPTRRVAQAMLPSLVAGFVLGVVVWMRVAQEGSTIGNVVGMRWLPLGWVVLYGSALCAAGFFTPRGIRLFGWAFIAGGCGLFALGIPDWPSRTWYAHGIMGSFFGALQLAYGVYLYLTEPGRTAV